MINAASPALIIGGGNMGAALARGWSAAFGTDAVMVLERSADKCRALESDLHIRTGTPNQLVQHVPYAGAVILAVKPDAVLDIVSQLSSSPISPNAPIISVAAGIELARYEAAFGQSHPIIRTMPNIGVQVAHGVTACIANNATQQEHQAIATALFESVGHCYWLEDEMLMHAITAISGSGPAYVFYFMECLMLAARNLGLPEPMIAPLVWQTIHGSTILAQHQSDKISDLRISVTSPNGTTQAALELLFDGLPDLMKAATLRAQTRSRELTQI